jgi:hypothetical protein
MWFFPTYSVTTKIFRTIYKHILYGGTSLEIQGFSGTGKSHSLILLKIL